MRIYTRRGDNGETGLLYGGRVSKSDSRCEAYGTVDEAVSALGLARSLAQDVRVREVLRQVQRELFTVGAELATATDDRAKLEKNFSVVTPEMTQRIEGTIDSLNDEIELPRSFIIPGASTASAALDVARSVLRRAERRVVALQEQGRLWNPELLRYLNRAADLIFILARYENRDLPFDRLTAEDQESTA